MERFHSVISDHQEVGGKHWPGTFSVTENFCRAAELTQLTLVTMFFSVQWSLAQGQSFPQPWVAVASGACVWEKEEVLSSSWHWSLFGRLGCWVNLGTWVNPAVLPGAAARVNVVFVCRQPGSRCSLVSGDGSRGCVTEICLSRFCSREEVLSCFYTVYLVVLHLRSSSSLCVLF